ncbi:MAG: tRNA pseudouridine(55) synthase TruB [Armatimonadota bacterium]|nr:MAG: tRNA pseudouridine(55) synthase TruB [Armatimonadota bacterium]
MAADGFLNLIKPPGMTSHDAVVWLRRLTHTAAGHTGTLDRAAAGVLVLCVGRARRLSKWVVESDKAYVGEITFGITTDTLDAEGQITSERDFSGLSAQQIERELTRFEGEIEQSAPAYSAVHADGARLYELARQGQDVPRRTRTVQVHSLRLLDFHEGVPAERASPPVEATGGEAGLDSVAAVTARLPRARIAVECSKGTYIRSLAADLGEVLGCGGCLSFLVRTRSGPFDIADSVTIERVEEAIAGGRFEGLLRPLDEPLSSLPAVTLEPREARLVAHGSTVEVSGTLDACGMARMYDAAGRFIGLGEPRGATLRPRVVVI